jgi:hypothetical protein
MRWLPATAAAFLFAPLISASEPNVSLTLTAEARQRVADGLVVRAAMTLEGGADYVVLPPLMDVPPWVTGAYPVTAFVVEVTDAAGKRIVQAPPPEGTIIYVQTEPPRPCQFHILNVGDFSGRVLQLGDPSYRYVLPRGKVRVTLRSYSSAREWLAGSLAKGTLREDELCFRPEDVFTTRLVSNTVEVTLE